MPLQFTVLASGSLGNASLLVYNGFGLLLDAGLGPRQLAGRLAAVGATWNHVRAAILTHTHSDHWKNSTLAYLSRKGIPLFCHPEHHQSLRTYGSGFGRLLTAGLVRDFAIGPAFEVTPGLSCKPVPLRHDCDATVGFRFEAVLHESPRTVALGYAADLGSWEAGVVQAFADVDVLALEFNHDVEMEYASGRSPDLIARVLGADGHLSNNQAGELLREVLRQSASGRLQQVVQLHLSRDCNRPRLARQAAQTILQDHSCFVELHTASQYDIGPTLLVGARARLAHVPKTVSLPVYRPRRERTPLTSVQWLPGMEPW